MANPFNKHAVELEREDREMEERQQYQDEIKEQREIDEDITDEQMPDLDLMPVEPRDRML